MASGARTRWLWGLLAGTWLAAGGLAGPEARAAELQLTWVDNSGGQASFSVERKATGGVYEHVATLAAGEAAYRDAAVAAGAVYCYRVQAHNEAGASSYSNEACGAVAQGLDVTVAVTGSGSVVSLPAGISCGTDCAESYASGTVVTLTALPAAGAVFSGWGGPCSGTLPCTVSGNGLLSVTATFAAAPAPPAPTSYTLSVSRSGPGSVTSQPAGIDCGSDCAQSYADGTVVTLTAAPKGGWTFAGWSGACSGTGSCTVTLGADRAVQAAFVKRQGGR
jgi:hypothetical protein